MTISANKKKKSRLISNKKSNYKRSNSNSRTKTRRRYSRRYRYLQKNQIILKDQTNQKH